MTELTSADLDAMEKLSVKATPGPWHVHQAAKGASCSVCCPDNWPIAEYPMFKYNAAFIAACDPSTIQRLIALARRGLSIGRDE